MSVKYESYTLGSLPYMVTQITKDKLSIQLGAAHRRVLGKFVEHEDVSHVLCFESPLSGVPRLVPVGKGLEYETVESALAKFESTASTVFQLDCRAKAETDTDAVHVVEQAAKDVEVTSELLVLREELKRAKARIVELQEVAELRRILDEHEQHLIAREQSLMKMEDELMMRMHQHMEQVADLEQREETLGQLEYAFERKSVTKLA